MARARDSARVAKIEKTTLALVEKHIARYHREPITMESEIYTEANVYGRLLGDIEKTFKISISIEYAEWICTTTDLVDIILEKTRRTKYPFTNKGRCR